MGTTYKCAACGEVFDSAWSDEEAWAESKDLWGDHPPEDMAVICDDCFQAGLPDAQAEYERTKKEGRDDG